MTTPDFVLPSVLQWCRILCLLSRQPPGSSPGDKGGKNRGGRGFKKQVFEAYMSQEDVSQGLKRGELLQVPLEGGREGGWLA